MGLLDGRGVVWGGGGRCGVDVRTREVTAKVGEEGEVGARE